MEDAGDTCELLVELLVKSPEASSAAPRAEEKVKTWSKVSCKKENVTDCFINMFFLFPSSHQKEQRETRC